ncbi:MAG: YecR family lipoprotein [Pseudomonadota bacterium]
MTDQDQPTVRQHQQHPIAHGRESRLVTRLLSSGGLLPVLLLAGCSYSNIPVRIPTTKTAEVLEVDRDTNIVRMGSPYLYLEKPDVDWGQAREDAAAQCAKEHGFTDAEPVGTTRRECLSWNGGDCVRYAIVGDYRCI